MNAWMNFVANPVAPLEFAVRMRCACLILDCVLERLEPMRDYAGEADPALEGADFEMRRKCS